MFARLAFLFVTIPLVELYLLYRLTLLTGNFLTTVAIVLLTGVLGAFLAKQQGLNTLHRIQRATAEGRVPGTELMDGGMILFAAALLLTPGVLTDVFGFSLLAPPCRRVYRAWLAHMFRNAKGNFRMHVNGAPFKTGHPNSVDDDASVIDGEARPVRPSSTQGSLFDDQHR